MLQTLWDANAAWQATEILPVLLAGIRRHLLKARFQKLQRAIPLFLQTSTVTNSKPLYRILNLGRDGCILPEWCFQSCDFAERRPAGALSPRGHHLSAES